MPRLDGVDAALALRAVHPAIQIALQSSDPEVLRDRAGGLGLPLFDKPDFKRLLDWVERQATVSAPRRKDHRIAARVQQKRELVCSRCGYGIVSRTEPERCPMCGRTAAWVARSARPRGAVRNRFAG